MQPLLMTITVLVNCCHLQKDGDSRGKTVTGFKEALEQVLQCDDMEEVKLIMH